MRTVLHGFVLFVALTATPIARASLAGKVANCAAHLCVAASSVACVVEQTVRVPFLLATLGRAIWKHRDGSPLSQEEIIITDRNPNQVLDAVGLNLYDFSNKTVLDVGAGKSRFGQVLNLIYFPFGTRIQGIDVNTTGPFLNWPGRVTKADAFHMPFENGSFDLTLNSFMFIHFIPREFSEQEKGLGEMEKARDLLAEHIRVTKPGGQIRISLREKRTSEKSAAFLQFLLERDPRVESFSFHYKTFNVGVVAIRLRSDADKFAADSLHKIGFPENPNDCRPVDWIWAGFPVLESTAALAIVVQQLFF